MVDVIEEIDYGHKAKNCHLKEEGLTRNTIVVFTSGNALGFPMVMGKCRLTKAWQRYDLEAWHANLGFFGHQRILKLAVVNRNCGQPLGPFLHL